MHSLVRSVQIHTSSKDMPLPSLPWEGNPGVQTRKEIKFCHTLEEGAPQNSSPHSLRAGNKPKAGEGK